MEKKRCTKCGKIKNTDGFYRWPFSKCGLSSWCIKCKREYGREYYSNRIELPGIEGIDYVVCLVCNKKFKTINTAHLCKHGLTLKEYQKIFPDCCVMSELYQKALHSRPPRKGRRAPCFGLRGKKAPAWKGGISMGYRTLTGCEGIDFIVCPLCKRRFFCLASHLPRVHKITAKELRQQFPTMQTGCRKTMDKLARSNVIRFQKQNRRPTKPELKLQELFHNNFLGEFKYTGDGSVWISIRYRGKLYHLNPDFMNINGKKIVIEMFGDYWHGKAFRKRHNVMSENKRRKLFAGLGFKMLVIWEHELKEPEKVVERIRSFKTRSDLPKTKIPRLSGARVTS